MESREKEEKGAGGGVLLLPWSCLPMVMVWLLLLYCHPRECLGEPDTLLLHLMIET